MLIINLMRQKRMARNLLLMVNIIGDVMNVNNRLCMSMIQYVSEKPKHYVYNKYVNDKI